MTTEQLSNELQDSVNLGDINKGLSSYYNYMLGRCHHPVTIKRVDSVTNELREFTVPCGRCLHCRQTKRTEWVQRLYAHSESYKYVYFTTLTYAPIPGNGLNDVSNYLLRYLSDAIWSYDSENTTNSLAYSPCLLVKSHYQKFIKRLRASLPVSSKLSYYLCGEYGKRHGRPHFHLILFSNTSISSDTISEAWSVKYHVNANGDIVKFTNQLTDNFVVPIGRIDHQDLKKMGDFDQIGNNRFSANHCFRYVCKYILKRQFSTQRIDIAYQSLYPLAEHSELSAIVVKSCKADLVHQNNIFIPETIDLSKYPIYYEDFKNNYKPFTECSRINAIGKNFLLSHLAEYQEGNFVKPQFCDKGNNITPSYFIRKVRQSLFGLQCYCKQFGKKPSFVTGSLLNLRENLISQDFGKIFGALYYNPCPSVSDFKQALSSPEQVIKDSFDNVRYVCGCDEGQHYVFAYAYNRSQRDYVLTSKILLSEFVSLQLSKLNRLFVYHYKQLILLDNEKKMQNQVTDLLNRLDLNQTFGLHTDEDNSSDSRFYLNFSLREYICNKIISDYLNYTTFHLYYSNDF